MNILKIVVDKKFGLKNLTHIFGGTQQKRNFGIAWLFLLIISIRIFASLLNWIRMHSILSWCSNSQRPRSLLFLLHLLKIILDWRLASLLLPTKELSRELSFHIRAIHLRFRWWTEFFVPRVPTQRVPGWM